MGFLLTSLSVETLTAERYCGVALEKFWQSIRRKMPRLLCQGIKIFHVNAKLHPAYSICNCLRHYC